MKTHTETYDRLLNLLTGYISRIMARTILDQSLDRVGVSADRLSPTSLLPVVEQARIGIGMFCEPERLSSLMLDLANLCDESMPANEVADVGRRTTILPPPPDSMSGASHFEPPASGPGSPASHRAPASYRDRPNTSGLWARSAAR